MSAQRCQRTGANRGQTPGLTLLVSRVGEEAWGATSQLTPSGGQLVTGTEQTMISWKGIGRLQRRVDRQRANSLEVLAVAGHKNRMTAQRGRCNEGIRDGHHVVPPTQLRAQLRDMRGDGNPRQQPQQVVNVAFLANRQPRVRQQFAFRDHGNRGVRASAFHVVQEPGSRGISPQVIDQDVCINEVLHRLGVLALQAQLPFPSKPALVGGALWQVSSEQTGRVGHGASKAWRCRMGAAWERSDGPFHGLQLIFQLFKLLDDADDRSHIGRSLA